MKKAYWISLYTKIDNQENLKRYAETVTPIIKSYGGVSLVRGGKFINCEGDNFLRTVVWEFLIIKKLWNVKFKRIQSWLGHCKKHKKTYANC